MRRLIIVTLLLSLLLGILSSCGSAKKGITGNEWLVKQKDCLDDLQAYANGMDEVYVLYITGAITADDFSAELNLLRQQYKILLGFYDTMKSENPVIPESHSYISKRGSDAISRLYEVFQDILDNSVDADGVPFPADQLSYTYLAYRQVIINDLVEYMTALSYYESSLKVNSSDDNSADISVNDLDSDTESGDSFSDLTFAKLTFPDGSFGFSYKRKDIEVKQGSSSVVLYNDKYAICITIREDETYEASLAKTISIISSQTPYSFTTGNLELSNVCEIDPSSSMFTGILSKSSNDSWSQVYGYKKAIGNKDCCIIALSLELPLTVQTSIEMQENVDYIFNSIDL